MNITNTHYGYDIALSGSPFRPEHLTCPACVPRHIVEALIHYFAGNPTMREYELWRAVKLAKRAVDIMYGSQGEHPEGVAPSVMAIRSTRTGRETLRDQVMRHLIYYHYLDDDLNGSVPDWLLAALEVEVREAVESAAGDIEVWWEDRASIDVEKLRERPLAKAADWIKANVASDISDRVEA